MATLLTVNTVCSFENANYMLCNVIPVTLVNAASRVHSEFD